MNHRTAPRDTLLGRLPQDRALRMALSSFLVTRLIVVAAMALGAGRLPRLYHHGLLTEIALMWDGAWYAGIARDGYAIPPAPNPSNLAFPPLLPLLAHLAGAVFARLGLDAGDAAFAVGLSPASSSATFHSWPALYLLWRLVALDHPPAVADRTLWLVAAARPSASSGPRSTPIPCSCCWPWLACWPRRAHWAWAALLAGLATRDAVAGRPMLIGVLVVEWYAARAVAAGASGPGTAPRTTPGAAAAWIGLAPLPLLVFAAYLRLAFGNPWAVIRAHAAWGQDALAFFPQSYLNGASLLWESVTQAGPARDRVLAVGKETSLSIDLGLPLLYLALGWIGWRRGWLRPGDLAWLVGGIVFPLSSGTTIALARYVLPLWPALVVLARLGMERPWVAWFWRMATLALLATTAYLFANTRWIG